MLRLPDPADELSGWPVPVTVTGKGVRGAFVVAVKVSSDDVRAEAMFREVMALTLELEDKDGQLAIVEDFAQLAAVRHQIRRATRLWGAEDALLDLVSHAVPERYRTQLADLEALYNRYSAEER